MICGNDSCAGELTVWEMGMQVIASKDADIEDLKKRLVAAEKQLADEKLKTEELQANLEKTKVCE